MVDGWMDGKEELRASKARARSRKRKPRRRTVIHNRYNHYKTKRRKFSWRNSVGWNFRSLSNTSFQIYMLPLPLTIVAVAVTVATLAIKTFIVTQRTLGYTLRSHKQLRATGLPADTIHSMLFFSFLRWMLTIDYDTPRRWRPTNELTQFMTIFRINCWLSGNITHEERFYYLITWRGRGVLRSYTAKGGRGWRFWNGSYTFASGGTPPHLVAFLYSTTPRWSGWRVEFLRRL